MASAKDLKKKIQSISNTKKITRTMEMVSAAKAKQTQGRVEANTPYAQKLEELLGSLASGDIDHDLVRPNEDVDTDVLVVLTANRGLCGGYNTNILVQAERWIRARESEGRKVQVIMVGKKGASRFRFRKVPMHSQRFDIDDRPSFQLAEAFAEDLMRKFLEGEVANVFFLSTRYYSAGVQKPALTQLLPIQPPQAEGDEDTVSAGTEFIFEPDAATILESILPFTVSQLVYRLLIEAAASEQIARRLAMKLATDNAGELIRLYTRQYNRQRQASITQQIMEIVGGADALG